MVFPWIIHAERRHSDGFGNADPFGNIVLCVFVVLGALLRLAASFLQDAFSSPIVVKAFSIFSFLGLGLMGLSGSSFIMDDGSFVTVLGIFCALWMILAAFQLGCLYGAVKVVNPLGERFRAAFLVASVLTVVVYIILAILLKSNVGSSHMYGSFFWMGLVATAILFLVAFFFTRSRHVKVGLAAAYLSSFFAISIYLSAYAVKIPLLYKVEVGALKSAMAAAPERHCLSLPSSGRLAHLSGSRSGKSRNMNGVTIFKGESLEAYYGRIIQNTAYHR